MYVYMMGNYSTIKKETLPFVTPWMEFEDITPKWSKLDRERDKYCMISCVDLRAKKKNNLNSQVQSSDSRVWE